MDKLIMRGRVRRRIVYKSGKVVRDEFKNKILMHARTSGIVSLVERKPIYVTDIVFGDGGCDAKGVPIDEEEIDGMRQKLFGVTRAKKKVVAQINPDSPTQAIFTATLDYEDANGFNISEMGLLTSEGLLYSMLTFQGSPKTDDIKVDWDWLIDF